MLADCVLMYAQRGHGKRSSFYSDYTFGCWREADGKRELVPVGKAYFGFTDEELRWLDKWVRDHTTNRFGPVREVAPELVLEIAFDGIARSTRHKSGVAMRFPRINRIRTDKPAAEADTIDNLLRLLGYGGARKTHRKCLCYGTMIDPFGRHISYLRVSVTDRCDFRCVYCMAEDMTFLPKAEVLSLEELDRLCTRLRAPRRQEAAPDRRRAAGAQERDVAVPRPRPPSRQRRARGADAHHQRQPARQVRRASWPTVGVKRINVSMDTLDPDKFRELTRWGDLDQVMRGIDAAQDAGLQIKINAVALRGVNDMEFDELIRWSHGRGMDLTLIEVMPMGEIGDDARLDQYLPLSLARAEHRASTSR